MGKANQGEADHFVELQDEVHRLKEAVASHAVVD